jgi:formylglycine-generating enzyme required for sulfatase activity
VYQVKFAISTSAIEPDEVGVDTTPDENDYFSVTFDSSQFTNGNHLASATAYDSSGNYQAIYWYITIDNTTSGGEQAATPTFTPAPGDYSQAQVVTISCASDNVGIYYTLDGSEPTQESATVYWSPITISESTTLKARAFGQDYEPSDIATGYYNIENNTEPEGMVFVPAGSFTMGDTSNGIYEVELPTHQVTLNAFYISRYEQTYTKFIEFLNSYDITSWGSYQGKQLIDLNGAYSAFRYSNGTFSYDSNDAAPDVNCPVMEVNWYGAVVFSNWLSEEEGLTPCYDTSDWSCDMTANGYRLPTEAEWEYAARGASNEPNYLYSGSNFPGDVAWQSQNKDTYGTKVVGTRDPNTLGIYDMSGNVFEWCNDFFGDYSAEAQTNPTGPESSMSRVVRGGSWNTHFDQCRVSYRGNETPVLTEGNIGFRLVRNAE